MNDIIEIIKIGGPALGTSVIFLWYFDRLDTRTKTMVDNHLSHLTDAMNKNTVVLKKLSTLIAIMLKKKGV